MVTTSPPVRVVARSLLALLLSALATSAPPVFAEPFRFDLSNVDVSPTAVHVAGSFNDWNAEAFPLHWDGEAFAGDLSLPDGDHAFKFVATFPDGTISWMLDRTWPIYVADPGGHVNHLLVLQAGQRVLPDDLEAFEWISLEAGDVVLAGDFNAWRQGDVPLRFDADHTWRCWMRTPRPFQYKFVVDDLWMTEQPDEPRRVTSTGSGLGGENNLRLPIDFDDPDDWTAGSPSGERAAMFTRYRGAREDVRLHVAEEQARAGDYALAIALCREPAAAADPRGRPATSPDRSLRSLLTEADIHVRFGFRARAARCWDQVVERHPVAGETRTAFFLAADHRRLVGDHAAARGIYDRLLSASGGHPQDAAAILRHVGACYQGEGRHEEALVVFAEAAAIAPPPGPDDHDWAHWWTELLLAQGISHWRLGDAAAAAASFDRVLAVSPWPESQNVHIARQWRGSLGPTERSPTSASESPQGRTETSAGDVLE